MVGVPVTKLKGRYARAHGAQHGPPLSLLTAGRSRWSYIETADNKQSGHCFGRVVLGGPK